MKKKGFAGIVVAMGIFAGSAAYAAGCGMCGSEAKCNEPEHVKKFQKETLSLREGLKEKELKLRFEYGYDSVNVHRVEALEGEIKELKKSLLAAAEKVGVPPCCAL